jgi:hypothetical protein
MEGYHWSNDARNNLLLNSHEFRVFLARKFRAGFHTLLGIPVAENELPEIEARLNGFVAKFIIHAANR